MITKNEYNILTFFMMRVLFAGVAIHNICFIAKQDSWLSIIIAFIIGIIPYFLFIKLLNIEPNYNISQNMSKYLGKIGLIFNIILVIVVTLDASIILWNLSNFVSSQFLFKTPIWVIAIFFMLPVIYTTNKGISTIGRTATILFIISMIMYITCFITLIFEIDIMNIFPILETNFNSILDGSLMEISYNIITIFTLLSIPKKEIKDVSNKSLIKFYIFNFITTFLVVFFIIGIFGSPLTNLYQYPEFHILKTINIANFFQRVESLLAFQWLLDFIIGLVIALYFIKATIKECFKFKNETIIHLVTSLVIIVTSICIFKNNTVAYNFLASTYKYLKLILVVIPLILYIKILFSKYITNKITN